MGWISGEKVDEQYSSVPTSPSTLHGNDGTWGTNKKHFFKFS